MSAWLCSAFVDLPSLATFSIYAFILSAFIVPTLLIPHFIIILYKSLPPLFSVGATYFVCLIVFDFPSNSLLIGGGSETVLF